MGWDGNGREPFTMSLSLTPGNLHKQVATQRQQFYDYLSQIAGAQSPDSRKCLKCWQKEEVRMNPIVGSDSMSGLRVGEGQGLTHPLSQSLLLYSPVIVSVISILQVTFRPRISVIYYFSWSITPSPHILPFFTDKTSRSARILLLLH